jgi:hypothetical protein
MISNSNYAGWLIDRQPELEDDQSLKRLLRSEQTKSNVLYIRNPDNERQPTRIIGLSIEHAGELEAGTP